MSNNLQDLFLQSRKYRPELYLDPIVRARISSFAKLCESEELNSGLEKLERDIESALGDYLFVVARKN